MEWKSLFRTYILERGYDYYLEDKVTLLNKSDTEVIAEVEGSETYIVNIAFKNNSIENMECDCPYAMDGKFCKHMAATLYQLFDGNELVENNYDEDLQKNSMPQRINEEENEIENLLAKIPDKEKHQLIVKMLVENSELKNSLKLKYDFQMDAKQMLLFKKEIWNTVSNYSVRGFIDWNNAFDFCNALEIFLDERVNILIEKNCLLQAFELNNEVFRTIGTVDMDDSDGGTGMIAEMCYENWQKIYQKANNDEKLKIKEFFFKYKPGTLLDFIEEYLFEFKENELISAEKIVEAINELDKIIASKADTNDCGYIYSVVGGHTNVIEKRIEYMKKLGASKDEINIFLEKNRHFSVVRNIEIDDAIKNEDFEKALKILIESKQLDFNNKGLLEKYSYQMLELYKKTGNTSKYIEELKYNLLNCTQTDAILFKELKKIITDKEDWNKLSNEIISKHEGSYSIYAFLDEEKKYNQMMDMIEKSNNIFTLDNYLKVLSKNVPDRVIQFYTNYLSNEMERASERKYYRHLVKYLRSMSFCESGKENAKKIVENWKLVYRRRPALMDELRKAGY